VPAALLPAEVGSAVQPERGAAVPRVSAPTAAAAVPNEPKAVAERAPAASGGEAFLAYRRLLAKAITAHQSYPRLARLRGWQGTVHVELHIAAGDTLRDVLVTRSSGFDILDRSALDMVRQARPLPAAPEPLRSREFSVTVPIAFRLTD
ncbi:MAG: energy transducer TonB, partial [Betaproteobacteria bacterium]|nr:energy transducer TonB [Betaproteobacteria bacterium]